MLNLFTATDYVATPLSEAVSEFVTEFNSLDKSNKYRALTDKYPNEFEIATQLAKANVKLKTPISTVFSHCVPFNPIKTPIYKKSGLASLLELVNYKVPNTDLHGVYCGHGYLTVSDGHYLVRIKNTETDAELTKVLKDVCVKKWQKQHGFKTANEIIEHSFSELDLDGLENRMLSVDGFTKKMDWNLYKHIEPMLDVEYDTDFVSLQDLIDACTGAKLATGNLSKSGLICFYMLDCVTHFNIEYLLKVLKT